MVLLVPLLALTLAALSVGVDACARRHTSPDRQAEVARALLAPDCRSLDASAWAEIVERNPDLAAVDWRLLADLYLIPMED